MNNSIIKEPFLYRLLKPPAVALFRFIFHPQIIGQENILHNCPVVLAGNHKAIWDCFMVMAATKRCVHFLAMAELFGNWFTKWFFTTAGLIPVHRNRKDKAALVLAEKYLFNGCVIGVFPEGKTNKTTEPLLPFKLGAVKMARETDTPIVPFTINGRYRIFRRDVSITFHEPFFVESDNLKEDNEKLKHIIYSKLNI